MQIIYARDKILMEALANEKRAAAMCNNIYISVVSRPHSLRNTYGACCVLRANVKSLVFQAYLNMAPKTRTHTHMLVQHENSDLPKWSLLDSPNWAVHF